VSSLRERSGRKPGGQKGHKGETLRQVTDPNEVVNHYPPACSMCGVGLDPKTSVGHSARQVFDLPQPQPLVVTEHRAHDCECTACGAKTRALFPDSVNAPVQYGARITAFVIYLKSVEFSASFCNLSMGQAHAPSAHTGSPFSSLLSEMCLFAKQSATYKRPLSRVPHSPRFPSLPAFGRRPRCSWHRLRWAVIRNPSHKQPPSSPTAMEELASTPDARHATAVPSLIDEMTVSIIGKHGARSTPETGRHGRRPPSRQWARSRLPRCKNDRGNLAPRPNATRSQAPRAEVVS
jgi:zinc-finger binding domain of transposase IS66